MSVEIWSTLPPELRLSRKFGGLGPVADVIKLQGGATAYFPEKEKVLILHFVGDGVDAISFFKLPSLAVQFYLLYGNLRVLEKKEDLSVSDGGFEKGGGG